MRIGAGRFGGMALVVLLLGAVAQGAQNLRVVVTSVSGRDAFIDHGRLSGVATGMRVRFFPPGAASVEGVVVDVSANSARVEMQKMSDTPPVTTAGEVQIPEPQAQPATTTSTSTTRPTTTPEHPPWAREEEARTPDMPLLAPAFSKPADERPMSAHGRIFTQLQYADDQGGGRDSQYYLGRVGTSLTLTNPFHQGGEFRFDGEFDRRGDDLLNSGDSSADDAIVDRLSYAIGTEQYSPMRLELGRFTSYYLPEIGTVDGVESALRLQNGLSIGGGLGLYPIQYPRPQEGDDFGFHVFLDYSSEGPSKFSGAVGYQKTWHEGSADRDVIIAHANMWLTKSLWLYGSARIDIYTSGDTLKSVGPQLTEGWLQARYTPSDDKGAAISLSHYTWADVKRDELRFIPPDQIHDGRVDRIEFSVWHDILKNLRPTARVYYNGDQRDDGFGGELDMDWTKIESGPLPLDLHGAVFYTEGSYTRDMGFRTEARAHRGNMDVYVGYELDRYTPTDTQTAAGYFVRQTIRTGLGWQLGNNWYYSLEADRYFGDEENAYSLNSYLEYRF